MTNPENSKGISYYYRTDTDGVEKPCGICINPREIEPREIVRIISIQNAEDIGRISLSLGDCPEPLDFTREDLGHTPKIRQQVLEGLAKMAFRARGTIVILAKNIAVI